MFRSGDLPKLELQSVEVPVGCLSQPVKTQRARLRKTSSRESFDNFLVSLHELAKTCKFCSDHCTQKNICNQVIDGLLNGYPNAICNPQQCLAPTLYSCHWHWPHNQSPWDNDRIPLCIWWPDQNDGRREIPNHSNRWYQAVLHTHTTGSPICLLRQAQGQAWVATESKCHCTCYWACVHPSSSRPGRALTRSACASTCLN